MDLIKRFLEYIRTELGYSALTVSAYTRDLTQWADFARSADAPDVDPLTVTTSDLRTWIAYLSAQGMAMRSIKRKASALRSFFKFLHRESLIADNPAASLITGHLPKPVPVYVRTDETMRIIDDNSNAADDLETVRNTLILALFYTTGIRCSELTGLRDVDVDTQRGELKVLGKRNKQRVIPFGEELGALIDQYRVMRDDNPETSVSRSDLTAPLFTASGGKGLNRKTVYNVVHRLLSEGGAHAERLSPHVLRHSCATDMLNSGAPISTVREMLGHASLASTQVYTHVSYRDIQQNYQLAHPRAQHQKKGE